MNYPKSVFFNFLTVFFANYILPGIEITNLTKLPYLGIDLPFALIVGLLNSLIYPILKMIDYRVNAIRIGLCCLIINCVIYAFLKIAPIGIQIISLDGYLFASLFVAAGSFITNYLLCRSSYHPKGKTDNKDSFDDDETKTPE